MWGKRGWFLRVGIRGIALGCFYWQPYAVEYFLICKEISCTYLAQVPDRPTIVVVESDLHHLLCVRSEFELQFSGASGVNTVPETSCCCVRMPPEVVISLEAEIKNLIPQNSIIGRLFCAILSRRWCLDAASIGD